MVLIIILVSMFLSFEIGKRSEGFGLTQYFLASLLALLIVAATLYHMMTMTKPPIY